MDHEELRQDFNSMLSMSVLVEAPVYPDVPGFQWDKADIGKVSYILANRIQKLPNVDSVQSINEIVDYYLYNGITMDKWKGVDFPNPLKSGSNYLITAKVKSADDINAIYPEVQKIAAKFGHRAKISFSSPVLLFNEIDQTLARELLLSIFTSSFSIIFIFYFLTRSIRNTLIALYANLIPIAFIVILFYITGLSLNPVSYTHLTLPTNREV